MVLRPGNHLVVTVEIKKHMPDVIDHLLFRLRACESIFPHQLRFPVFSENGAHPRREGATGHGGGLTVIETEGVGIVLILGIEDEGFLAGQFLGDFGEVEMGLGLPIEQRADEAPFFLIQRP